MRRMRLATITAIIAAIAATCFGAAAATSFATSDAPDASIARRAGQFYRNHHLAAATAVLRRGIKQYPDSAQLHFMLGNALMRAHSWRSAIPEYQASAKLRPQHPDTYLNMGYACYHAGMTSQAVQAWRESARQSPHDALILATLAVGLAAKGDRDAALKEMAAAEAADPGWRRIAGVDFRWNQGMRADADRLAAEQARRSPSARPQVRRHSSSRYTNG